MVPTIASADTEIQGCLPRCWDNSQYVATCNVANETPCLCEDSQFQNVGKPQPRDWRVGLTNSTKAVLQCLYSQCPTTQFASAMHFALLTCSGTNMDTSDTLPPLIRHQGLRKRGIPVTGVVSTHASASAVHSVLRRSVSGSAYRQTPTARITSTTTAQLPTDSAYASKNLTSNGTVYGKGNESMVYVPSKTK